MITETAEPQTEQADVASVETERREAFVRDWTQRIRKAREKWAPDFERMRMNMEFAAGMQWHGQKEIDDERYVSNIVIRTVAQKVATLYARDPRVSAKRRQRLDFKVWDGKLESLMYAVGNASVPGSTDIASMAVVMDYMHGTQRRELIDKICRTLEIVYQWQVDQQEPEFKLQMKQLVRRVVTCGVGYVRLNFTRAFERDLTTSETDRSLTDRAKSARAILDRYSEGELDKSSSELETLRMLVNSLAVSAADGSMQNVDERLVFDFPPATSIIVDPRCRALKGFVGAQWIAQEFVLPLEEVNAFFGTKIEVGGNSHLVPYGEDAQEVESGTPGYFAPTESGGSRENVLACVWQVFDIRTRSTFFLCDGWHEYLKEPEPVEPKTNRFWPVFALTFNDIEVEPGLDVSVYPPSDVQLLKHAQKEWNRSRDALREHRKANTPRHVTGAGWLTAEDKRRLADSVPHEVIELQGVPPGTDVGKMVGPLPKDLIDPALYNTDPLIQDVLFSVGSQESNLGPADPNVTATSATIAEQSRLTSSSSNVDDIDDMLSDLAKSGGEMLFRGLSADNAMRIAGDGAAWPTMDRENYLNEIYLEVVAASSGRPNKAIEVANFERMAPLLMQAGANPHFLVREGLKRLDDRIQPEEAFPLIPPGAGMMQPSAQVPGVNPATPTQPLQTLMSQSPVPLAGHAQ